MHIVRPVTDISLSSSAGAQFYCYACHEFVQHFVTFGTPNDGISSDTKYCKRNLPSSETN
jgi:hypothetical protein